MFLLLLPQNVISMCTIWTLTALNLRFFSTQGEILASRKLLLQLTTIIFTAIIIRIILIPIMVFLKKIPHIYVRIIKLTNNQYIVELLRMNNVFNIWCLFRSTKRHINDAPRCNEIRQLSITWCIWFRGEWRRTIRFRISKINDRISCRSAKYFL